MEVGTLAACENIGRDQTSPYFLKLALRHLDNLVHIYIHMYTHMYLYTYYACIHAYVHTYIHRYTHIRL